MLSRSWRNPHIVRSAKSLLKTLYATAGVFLFLAVISHLVGALYVSRLADNAAADFEAGMAKEFAALKEGGDAVAANPLLTNAVLSGNRDELSLLLSEESARYAIPALSVADAQGILISRTYRPADLGANIFLTTPIGRAVTSGERVETIREGMTDPSQLIMATGRPVWDGSRLVGGLFASRLMDHEYASYFRDTYFKNGIEVAFYTKGFGIYGNSISDPETHQLVDSYFNSGSEWVQDGLSDQTVSFQDGRYYVVRNVVFPGMEESWGGAFLFIPRQDITVASRAVIALLALLTFVALALRHHFASRGEERGWRYWVLLGVSGLPVVLAAFFLLISQNATFLKLEKVPYPLYNSTLRFQPESGIYESGYEQRFTIMMDTGDEPVNAVQIGIRFDPHAIVIKEIEVASSTCSYVIERIIDAVKGEATLSCVMLSAHNEPRSLPVADVVVIPKRNGTFSLSFDNEKTAVLAHDGLGTNVLRMSQSSSYRVDDFSTTLTGSATSTGWLFIVFSPTHPNQSRWYRSSVAKFVWKGLPGSVYAYALSTSPDTMPSREHTTPGSEITLPLPGDGIYYFHLGLASGGPVAHYRVQVDRTPPTITSVLADRERIVAGDIVRFSFKAEDVASGIQQNYYINLGNHLFLPIGSELLVPFVNAGNTNIVLRVYDNAGNYAEKAETIRVFAK